MSELNPTPAVVSEQGQAPLEPEQVFFEGSPLLRGELGRTTLFGVVGILLIISPVLWYFLQHYWMPWYVNLGAVVVGLLCLTIPLIFTRMVRYRISSYRIDFERGLLGKNIDTLELWHVEDIKFHQSFIDRIMGVGTILIFADDATTPQLNLHGIPNARQVFDMLKQRIIKIKRSRGVVKLDTGHGIG